MAEMQLSDLAPGMRVQTDVQDAHGRVLIEAGKALTQRHLRALKIWGIPAVQVEGDGPAPDRENTSKGSSETKEKIQEEIRYLYQFNLPNLRDPFLARLTAWNVQQRIDSPEKEPAIPRDVTEPEVPPNADNPIPLDDLLLRVKTIGSLPTIYSEITEVIQHPLSSSADLARVISKDPGLTARLLHMVNSAMYSFASKIETVSRAITIVGTNEISQLALATSVIQMFKGKLEKLIDMNAFWRHSLCTGALARTLAAKTGHPNTERYFVSGLLHDLGRLVLFEVTPKMGTYCIQKARYEIRPLCQVEKEVLGYDHAEIGMELLKRWQLPESHIEPVGLHHKPSAAFEFIRETIVMHVSNVIANTMAQGRGLENKVPVYEPGTWDKLDIPLEALPHILNDVEGQMADLLGIFEVV